jgi:small GTP-binding protein
MSSGILSQGMMIVDSAGHRLKPAETATFQLISAKPLPLTRNVVICGESGVGKSSIVNMLAGEEVFEVGRGAKGTTFEHQGCAIRIGDQTLNIWDTAGLNENKHGLVTPEKAFRQLFALLREFGGVNLLVFAMRFRITKSTVDYYRSMRDVLCQESVPIIVAITNREFETDNEKWWQEIKRDFSRHKMNFSGHAIGTANQHLASDRTYAELRDGLRDAIQKYTSQTSPGLTPEMKHGSGAPTQNRAKGLWKSMRFLFLLWC